MQETLKKLEIDDTHCRHFQGENGFALVTLKETDRVFLGSNKGGIAKDHAFDFNEEDMDYIQQYDLIYTNLNSYIEQDLSKLYQTKVPIAYDFSMRWTDEYLRDVCPYVTVAIMSCAHLSEDEREREMKKAQKYGVSVVLGTVGEEGSYVLYKDKFLYTKAVLAEDVIDTMGAGDSYFAAFLSDMLKNSPQHKILDGSDEQMYVKIQNAMKKASEFAAKMCAKEGAFGYGVPITGRTEI